MLISTKMFSILFYFTLTTSPSLAVDALPNAEVSAINNPSMAISAYQQYKETLNTLPHSIQLRWHTVAIRAALNNSQFLFAEEVFREMNISYDKAGNNQKGYYFNLSGIWFRKNGFFKQAEQAYKCAFKTTKNTSEQFKIS